MRIIRSETFDRWLAGLRDQVAAARIQVRIDRLRLGNPGDVRAVGHGVSEMRIPHGPGYRVYFIREGTTMIILLCGGDKSSQTRDIRFAHELAKEWER